MNAGRTKAETPSKTMRQTTRPLVRQYCQHSWAGMDEAGKGPERLAYKRGGL